MAKFYDGFNSIPQIIEVRLQGKNLIVLGHKYPLKEVLITFLSTSEISLCLEDAHLTLNAQDQEFEDICKALSGSKRQHLKKAIGCSLSGLLFIITSFFMISFWTERLPDKYFKLLVKENFLVDLFPGTCRLEKVLNEEIMIALGEKNLNLFIVPLPSLNAFAYPFDQILVTEQMILSLNNDHELFAVLGHEAGHLKLKHYKGQLGRMLFIDVIGSVLDKGQVGSVAETLLLNSYTRLHEEEADRYAVKVMKNKGYPVMAGVSLMLLLQRSIPEIGPSILRSHPVTTDRIKFFLKESQTDSMKYPSTERKILTKIINACGLSWF